ncbi:MAG: NfeD family protein, partial [Methanomicrobium sp.]|nr:NfeD family protein [Methanomicrobium sp.]
MIEGIISVGWYLILIGVLFLAIETFNPGFFMGVPGTTLIIIGIVSLIVPDIFSSPLLIVIAVITALISAGISVWIYSLIGSGSTKPETTSKDSLIGKTGLVIKEVDSD